MATLASSAGIARGDRFFVVGSLLMALVLVAGFTGQVAMGRSSFAAPLLVHVHAVAFMGWIGIFVVQSWLGTRGPIALHRRLGWIATGWVAAMVVIGFVLMTAKVRQVTTPFFFQPQHFLISNLLILLVFAGLTAAAVAMRRRTDWHRRLHFCGMAALMGPGFGRLLPMPLLIPYAYHAAAILGLAFPVAGIVIEARRDGAVHPAWWWGLGVLVATLTGSELIVYSPLGDAIYAAFAAGSPGASIDPLAFPPAPPMP